MSIFDTNTVEKDVKLDDDDRVDLLLDHAFNQYCDWLLIDHANSLDYYLPIPTTTIEKFFESNFRSFFEAMAAACPMYWWPEWLQPYKIVYLQNIDFEEKDNIIKINILYKNDTPGPKGMRLKIYEFNKDWVRF